MEEVIESVDTDPVGGRGGSVGKSGPIGIRFDFPLSERKCPSCGGNLSRLPWGKDYEEEILVCNNINCQRFRRPVSQSEEVKA